jgi:hypothetical protein
VAPNRRSRRGAAAAAIVVGIVLAACRAQVVPTAPIDASATPDASPAMVAEPTATSSVARLPTASAGSSGVAIARSGRLTELGRMTVPRAVATATRLSDGRILIAGGCSDPGCDLGSAGGQTAELFDPARGTFTRTGDLTAFRDDHAAVLLPDGRVVLLGGWGAADLLAATDVYDPSTGRFSPGPSLSSGRAGIVPITMDDGRILVAGGFVGNRPTIAGADLLDPRTLAVAPTGSMIVPRGAYAAARLADGRVLVAGGLSEGLVTPTAELYDPATGTFRATGSMATARYKGGAVLLPDGRALVYGGSGHIDGTILFKSSELYDPATGTFSPGPPLERARYKLADSTIRLGSGDYLVAGGAPQPELLSVAGPSFESVDGSLGGTRLFLAAAPIDDRRVLLVGGYDRVIRPTDQAWLYEAPSGG